MDDLAGDDVVEVNLDFGVIGGYFIRLDIYMRDGSGATIMPCLSPALARSMATALVATADEADERNRRIGQGGQGP